MKKLALIDVDGTLTATVEVDLKCFLRALADLFGFPADAEAYDWDAVPHATDPSLLLAAFRQFAAGPPTRAERDAFLAHFLRLLRAAAARAPLAFAAVRGAGGLLAELGAARDWSFAIATGCFVESALFKLETAGLAVAGVNVTSASEAVSREEIFGRALERETEDRGARVVVLGDGTWDAVTARKLGLGFVGVATGEQARRLEGLGASAVVADYSDLEGVLTALDVAAR